MDTSETYIKMCDCPEIQENMKDDRCSFWANKLITGKYSVMCGYKQDIWLPRQDQIQEMVGAEDKNTSFEDWISKLLSFIKFHLPWDVNLPNGYKTIGFFETFEQIWLGLYMAEEHGKIWNGEKWINKIGGKNVTVSK